MPWYTETACSSLEKLSPVRAIQAIHAALCQLEAAGDRIYSPKLGTDLDNRPAMEMLRACMKEAGHIGYREE